MLDLKGNLKWAENAVKYTKERMIQEALGGWIGNKICTRFSRFFIQPNNERSMCNDGNHTLQTFRSKVKT